jgi:hypothetical protein
MYPPCAGELFKFAYRDSTTTNSDVFEETGPPAIGPYIENDEPGCRIIHKSSAHPLVGSYMIAVQSSVEPYYEYRKR